MVGFRRVLAELVQRLPGQRRDRAARVVRQAREGIAASGLPELASTVTRAARTASSASRATGASCRMAFGDRVAPSASTTARLQRRVRASQLARQEGLGSGIADLLERLDDGQLHRRAFPLEDRRQERNDGGVAQLAQRLHRIDERLARRSRPD